MYISKYWSGIVLVVLVVTLFFIINFTKVSSTGTDFRSHAANVSSNQTDVIIVGAGTGGIGAAIQVARQGLNVILVEETDWIGGQMTAAGVSSLDYGDLRWSTGIFGEFIERIKTYYKKIGKSVSTCYWSAESICFEPNVGQKVLQEMLSEYPNISVKLRTNTVNVTRNGNTITGVTIKSGKNISVLNAKVVVDATEYGDLLLMAGTNYRSGNSTNSKINVNACIQDITYLAVIKKYPNGVPKQLVMMTPPPGYDKGIFVNQLTVNGSQETNNLPVNFAYHNAYRGMPDSSNKDNYNGTMYNSITKTGLNWFNDYPVTVRYLENPSYRKAINCQAKLKTLQLLYYIQHDLGYSNWSVANDEGFNTPYNRENNSCSNIPQAFKSIENNLPVIPYIRESRRAIGNITLTAKDIKRVGTPPKGAKTFASSIAIADYNADLHNCRDNSSLESELENINDKPVGWVTGPFQVPMETLIPDNIDGLLLAEKNISQSRLTNGATRLQPSTMIIGQATGALASIAIKQNVSPRKVAAVDVQKVLLNNSSLLYPFFDISSKVPYFFDINAIALRGIVNGYTNGNYGYNNPITRAEMSVILTRVFNVPISNPTIPTFMDVPTNYWGYRWIQSIYQSGLTAGCLVNPMNFCPEDSVTNAQVAVFEFKGLKLLNTNMTLISPTAQTYIDVPPSHWAYKYVETMASLGVKWYCNKEANKFCPDDPILRGTTAYVTNTILNKITNSSRAVLSLDDIPSVEDSTTQLKPAIIEISR